MIHVSRVGFIAPKDESATLSIETLLQRVLRDIEGRGSLIISASVIAPSHIEGETAESFIVHASMDIPAQELPGPKIVVPN